MRLVLLLLLTAVLSCAAEDSSDDDSPVISLSSYMNREVQESTGLLVANLNRSLREVTSRLDAVNERLDAMDKRLDAMDEMLDGLVALVALDQLQGMDRELAELNGTRARDCSDLPVGADSGVYLLVPDPSCSPILAYCDQDTAGGGWTVFQRRADFQPREDFFVGWQAYKAGFGDPRREFWLGLENIRCLTSQSNRQFQLRIDLEDGGEKRYAVYQGFSISSESDGYRLSASSYSGNAGESLKRHIGQRFSTKDKDQDPLEKTNCANMYKGGWWYNNCHSSNLNAIYRAGPARNQDGISWSKWKGNSYSLQHVEMKLRPA